MKALIDRDPKGFIFACLAYGTSAVFLPCFPAFCLVVYLYHFGAFSYDIFMPDIFGLGLFAAIAGILLFSLSILQFGSLPAICYAKARKVDTPLNNSNSEGDESVASSVKHCSGKQGKGKSADNARSTRSFGARVDRILLALFVAFMGSSNLLLNAGLIIFWISSDGPEELRLTLAFSVVSVTISSYLATLVAGAHRATFALLLILPGILGLVSLGSPEYIADVTSEGLAVFGLGGSIPVQIRLNSLNHSLEISGQLVLLAPETVLIQEASSGDRILLVDRSSISEMWIESRKGRILRRAGGSE